MVFFESYIIASYNKNIGPRLMTDCHHYANYRHPETFIYNVIKCNLSYMGCLAYESKSRKRVSHSSIPILIGSYIDFCIRGKEAVENSRVHWGCVIIKGSLKFYTSFSTFDALSLHVRQTGVMKSIEWFMYTKQQEGLAIKYSNKIIEWVYNHNNYNNITESDTSPNYWITLVNNSNPFISRNILSSEYIQLFDAMLSHPYDMNDLKNRQILSFVTIFNKYIEMVLSRRKKRGSGSLKLSDAFENGTFFIALSKKNIYENNDWFKKYHQTYENTLHDGRSSRAVHFLSTVSRASNDAVRNSKALVFPKDAFGYFCLLNTKDLKSAGEQNVISDFVIMTEESDQFELYWYLRNESTGNGNHLILNGFIIDCRKVWTFEDLIKLKQKIPHVTTKYYDPYILFSTKSSIPIKYSTQYNVFFSPAETTKFDIQYPEDSLLSVTANMLNSQSIKKSLPTKITVAINNIKGSVANIENNDKYSLHKHLNEMSLGTTCSINITNDERQKILDSAIVSRNNDTSIYFKYKNQIDEKLKLTQETTMDTSEDISVDIANNTTTGYDDTKNTEKNNLINSSHIDDNINKTDTNKIDTNKIKNNNNNEVNDEDKTNIKQAMESLVFKMFDQSKLLLSNQNPYELSQRQNLNEYLKLVFGSKYYEPPYIWNLQLWAGFGNLNGFCVEDGVVVDKKTADMIPPIVYNACYTVYFTYKPQPKHKKITITPPIFHKMENPNNNNDTLIGCLITNVEVNVKTSKHCTVRIGKIGNHYYNFLHFTPKEHGMYTNLNVRFLNEKKVMTVIVTGTRKTYFSVGTKIANDSGQKNIVSAIEDLSPTGKNDYTAVTKDGERVHAQILFSSTSIVGRITSAQVYDMISSNKMAIGKNGFFLAKINICIHALNPFRNIKVFCVKLDTLTNINGFDSQCLNGASYMLRETYDLYEKTKQVIGLCGYNLKVLTPDQYLSDSKRYVYLFFY